MSFEEKATPEGCRCSSVTPKMTPPVKTKTIVYWNTKDSNAKLCTEQKLSTQEVASCSTDKTLQEDYADVVLE